MPARSASASLETACCPVSRAKTVRGGTCPGSAVLNPHAWKRIHISRPGFWTYRRQKQALQSLDNETRNRLVRVIARLNDIGQLVEDGFISRRIFLGKYHVLIIQCCHMVEVVRRDEEKKRGGNYGHRLLRMRRWATAYNDIWPKHRHVPVEITSGSGEVNRRVIYRSPRFSFIRRAVLALRGYLSLY